MNKKHELIREILGMLKPPEKDYCVRHPSTNKFYELDDVDYDNMFLPKESAEGIKAEHMIVENRQCYKICGIYLYF